LSMILAIAATSSAARFLAAVKLHPSECDEGACVQDADDEVGVRGVNRPSSATFASSRRPI